MSKTKIDYEAHRILTNKYVFTLFFSLLWREVLLKYIPMIVICAFFIAPMLGPDLNSDKSMLTLIGFTSLVSLLLLLLTSQYIFNSLVRIKHKEFRVCAVKDNKILDKLDFYDSLCWWGSLIWRHVVLIVVCFLIIFVIGHFKLLPQSILSPIISGGGTALSMLGFFWVLKTKKTGSLMLIQPVREG